MDRTRHHAEARRVGDLVRAVEQQLHADADAEERSTGRDRVERDGSRPEVRNASMHAAERTDAREHDGVGAIDEHAIIGEPRVRPTCSRPFCAERRFPMP